MSLAVPKVSRFGEDFGYVEHILRMQSGLPSIEIDNLFDISLKPINTQFDNFVKRHAPLDVVDIFVPVASVKQNQKDVIAHGIKVHPKDGFKFTTNSIQLEEGENQLYHIQVALGAVLNHQDLKEPIDEVHYLHDSPTITNLQEGFSSLRVGDNTFVVFGQPQVRALHLVVATYTKGVDDRDPTNNVCEQCGDVATLYCHNCNKKLCEKCSTAMHKDQYMKEHKIEPLEKAITQIQKCPEHPDQNIQYYCMKCHKPVCMVCKVKGHHAHGEFAKHKLIPIEQAYKDGLKALKKSSPFFEQREKVIKKGIQEAEAKIDEIQENQKNIEEEIMRIAMKAIQEARLKSCAVANEVKSAQQEYIRKLDELKRQRDLLNNYRDHGEPLPFLQAAYRNLLIEETIIDHKDLPEPLTQKGNLIVYGRLDVQPPKIPESQAAKSVKDRALPEEGQSTYSYTQTASTTLEERDPHFTRLEKMATRKLNKYTQQNVKYDFDPFAQSTIITDAVTRQRLYLSLPFRGVPEPHILYSSAENGLNIHTMHKLVDGMGITCVICKVGTQVFGGFAASKWDSTGKPKKDKASTFLFQINKDAFIPYGGQSEDPCYMVATPDTLSFGGLDLKLGGTSFDDCSSELENSFGIGLVYGSKKSKEFLAGKHKFALDAIEVWGFFSAD